MVLHTEDGRRLHIDKETLRHWREHFAHLMREQGIAANAIPRFIRGQSKGKVRDAIYRAQQHGSSTIVRQRVIGVVAPFTIFNIGGNKFRIVAMIHYNTGRVYVREVLTHPEYDKWSDDYRRRKRPRRGK